MTQSTSHLLAPPSPPRVRRHRICLRRAKLKMHAKDQMACGRRVGDNKRQRQPCSGGLGPHTPTLRTPAYAHQYAWETQTRAYILHIHKWLCVCCKARMCKSTRIEVTSARPVCVAELYGHVSLEVHPHHFLISFRFLIVTLAAVAAWCHSMRFSLPYLHL